MCMKKVRVNMCVRVCVWVFVCLCVTLCMRVCVCESLSIEASDVVNVTGAWF